MNLRYFGLSYTPNSASVEADRQWLSASRTVLYPAGCKHENPGLSCEQISVVSAPRRESLHWVSPLRGVHLAKGDLLLDILGPVGIQDVRTFAVASPSGTPGRYLAFKPLRSLLVRGGASSTLKGACEKCGLSYYWPQPAREPEKWYLVRESLKEERAIYEGSAVEMIIREDIFERVRKLNLRETRLRELPILDQPLDGLPVDLPTYLTPERQQELGDLLTRDITEYDRRYAERMASAKAVERSD